MASFAAALYAAWPLLWRDPSELAEAVRVLSRHPAIIADLFRGELVEWPNIPWDYIPAWILITTPPIALALAALGIAAVAARVRAADWRDTLGDSTARFGLLTAACLILPVAAAIALNSNLYNGWRQMYFLHAPMSVLAAFGLRCAAAAISKPRRLLRAAALAIAALGIALVVVQMVRIHHYQNDYFNFLANKTGVSERWMMDYWNVSHKAALERMLILQPAGRVSVNPCEPGERFYRAHDILRNFALIPREDRMRMSVNEFSPDFCIAREAVENAAWTREVYGETILSLVDMRDAARADYAAAYAAAKSAKPDYEAHFDVYAVDGMLIYLREPCAEGDERGTFKARAHPFHPDETRRYALEDGFDKVSFGFRRYGGIIGDACLMALRMPDYPIESVTIAYRPRGSERDTWSADILVNDHIKAYETAMSALPFARSGYDIYADGGALIYLKPQCAEDDIRARFFLSVFPSDPADLPQERRDAGLRHEPLNFNFHQYGAAFDGKCVIIRRDLPDYPIDSIETDQWIAGERGLWRAEFAPPDFYERRIRLAESSGEPGIRADFDVYLEGDSLLYIRKDCANDDARGRFCLSAFPENPADLPQERRDAGFEHESLNFDFHGHGAVFDGKCVIVRELPDYPIASIETGQFIPGEGELWRGRIDAGE